MTSICLKIKHLFCSCMFLQNKNSIYELTKGETNYIQYYNHQSIPFNYNTCI